MRNFTRNFMILSIGCRPYMHRRRISTVYSFGHDTVLTTWRYLNWRFSRNTRFSSHFDPAAVCGRESNPPHCPEKLNVIASVLPQAFGVLRSVSFNLSRYHEAFESSTPSLVCCTKPADLEFSEHRRSSSLVAISRLGADSFPLSLTQVLVEFNELRKDDVLFVVFFSLYCSKQFIHPSWSWREATSTHLFFFFWRQNNSSICWNYLFLLAWLWSMKIKT